MRELRQPRSALGEGLLGLMLGLFGALLTGAFIPASTSTSAVYANWGSGINHPCDDTEFSQCIANNYSHSVYLSSSLQGRERTAMGWAIGELNLVADVVAFQTTSQADVIVYEVNEPGVNYFAWGECAPGATHGGTDPREYCYPQHLKLNTGKYGSTQFNTDNKAYTICLHELGHTMGLRHSRSGDDPSWSVSAMRYYTSQPNTLYRFTTHDKSHLSGNY